MVVRTSSATLLFDTGSAGDRKGLVSGLKMLGLDPVDVDIVILSHLHFDHASNIELFSKSTIVVHEAEINYAVRHEAIDVGLARWLTAGLVSCGPRIVADELEFGPRVRIIRTPGHTAGHISLVVESEDGVVILAGDAIKDRTEAADKCSASAFDPRASTASIERILDLADIVVPGHDVALRVGQSGGVEPINKRIRSPLVEKNYAAR